MSNDSIMPDSAWNGLSLFLDKPEENPFLKRSENDLFIKDDDKNPPNDCAEFLTLPNF